MHGLANVKYISPILLYLSYNCQQWPWRTLYRLSTFHVRISRPFPLSTPYQIICPGARLSVLYSLIFYGKVLLARRPTPNLEDHPLTVTRDCFFNISAATVHIYTQAVSSNRNLRTRHVAVTGSHRHYYSTMLWRHIIILKCNIFLSSFATIWW